jgi:hypothetical protein
MAICCVSLILALLDEEGYLLKRGTTDSGSQRDEK